MRFNNESNLWRTSFVTFSGYRSIKMGDSSLDGAVIDVALTITTFLDAEEFALNKKTLKTTMRATDISLIFFFK
jgi:hypothetical protein